LRELKLYCAAVGSGIEIHVMTLRIAALLVTCPPAGFIGGAARAPANRSREPGRPPASELKRCKQRVQRAPSTLRGVSSELANARTGMARNLHPPNRSAKVAESRAMKDRSLQPGEQSLLPARRGASDFRRPATNEDGAIAISCRPRTREDNA